MSPKPPRSLFDELAAVIGIALFLRLGVAFYLFHKVPFHWGVNEAGTIAESLLVHHSYGPAFANCTGPTAWVAPVYPFLLAGIFFLFGIKTVLAAEAAACLNCIFGAATVIPIYKIGELVFGPTSGKTSGKVAALLFALCPYEMLIPYIPWETTLSGLLLTCALWLTLRALGQRALTPQSTCRESLPGRRPAWLLCGMIWGLLALTSPAMLAPLPFLVFWIWRRAHWKPAVTVAATTLMVIGPWLIRNGIVLHEPVLRTDAWAEVYFGNIDYSEHPGNPQSEYRTLGEVAFERHMRERVVDYVETNPGRFLFDSAKRAARFWRTPENFFPLPEIAVLLCLAGILLAINRGVSAIPFLPALLLVLLCCPIIFYFCYAMSRYRYPIEPVMWVFAGYAVDRFAANLRATLVS